MSLLFESQADHATKGVRMETANSALQWKPLLDEELFLIRSAEAHGPVPDKVTLQDAASMRLVLPSGQNSTRRMIDSTFHSAGLQLKLLAELDSLSTVQTIVESGQAATITSLSAFVGPGVLQRLAISSLSAKMLVRRLSLCTSEVVGLSRAAGASGWLDTQPYCGPGRRRTMAWCCDRKTDGRIDIGLAYTANANPYWHSAANASYTQHGLCLGGVAMNKILAGTVVLDLTRFFSGPQATLLLAGMGAEVIKIDDPATGDPTAFSPPFAGPDGIGFERRTDADMGIAYLKRARGKKSVLLDLKKPDGHATFLRLVSAADVVIDNFSAGVAERLGIDYASLVKVNPCIISCSLTGYGGKGPGRKVEGLRPDGSSGRRLDGRHWTCRFAPSKGRFSFVRRRGRCVRG